MFNFKQFCLDRRITFLEEGHHHCHEGWQQIHCQFCGTGQDGWHLGFSLEGGYFNCWRCGKHSVWDVLAKITKANKAQVYELIEKYETNKRAATTQKRLVRKRQLVLPLGAEKLQKQHRQYLRGRGFSPSALEREWGILGTGHLGGQWSWRIIIPICDQKGQVVAYQGRALQKDRKPRYKMTNDCDILVDPKSLLFGLHRVENDSVIVVEGAPGVWRLGRGAVATLGIGWHVEQANILRSFKNRYILFDPEPVAQKRAMALATWLSFYPGTTEILSGHKTDPGDFSPRKVRRIRQSLGFVVN